jgi:hypothetical protein
MKILKRLVRGVAAASVALAVIGMMSAPSSAWAQKGGEKLMQLNQVKTFEDLQALDAGDTLVMSCPKCKTTWVKVVEKTFKGAKAEELKSVEVDLCDSCTTKIVTKGSGKSAQNVLVHTCKTCGSKQAFCCVKKKGAGPTMGMEEKK